jgi:hypothetical protein
MRACLPAKPIQPVILLGCISTDCKIRLWPVQKILYEEMKQICKILKMIEYKSPDFLNRFQ